MYQALPQFISAVPPRVLRNKRYNLNIRKWQARALLDSPNVRALRSHDSDEEYADPLTTEAFVEETINISVKLQKNMIENVRTIGDMKAVLQEHDNLVKSMVNMNALEEYNDVNIPYENVLDRCIENIKGYSLRRASIESITSNNSVYYDAEENFQAQSLDINSEADMIVVNKRINIELLIQRLQLLSVGEQHKLCSKILKETGNLDRTRQSNSVKSIKRLAKVFRRLKIKSDLLENIRKIKFQAQMLGVFDDLSTIAKAANSVESLLDKDLGGVKRSVDNLSHNIGEFNVVIQKIKSLYAGNNAVYSVCKLLNKMYLVFATMYKKCDKDIIVSAIFNMVEGLVPPTYLSKLLKDILNSPDRASEDVLNFEAQSSDNNTSFTMAIFNSVTMAFMGLFKNIDKGEYEDFAINVKKVSALNTLMRSCKSLLDFVIQSLDFVLRYVIKAITKRVGFVPKHFIPESLDDIYKELETIENDDIVTQSLTSIGAARKIIQFRDKINKFLMFGMDDDVNKLMMMHLNFVKREAESWYKNIPPYLKDIPGSDREKPVWIYIFGKPRIGKTTLISKALVYRCAKKMGLTITEEKWDAFVYNRNLGEEYWEGYNGHPVVSYTDIIQEIKDEKKLDLSITELTRVNDGNAYSLPMAFEGPKGKGKNFFTSKLIVSDAQGNLNIGPLMDRCWSGGTHIFARRTVVLEVVLNPKYQDHIQGNGGEKSVQMGIDISKFEAAYEQGNYVYKRDTPICPRDAYIFKIRDNVNHKVIKEITDFDSGIEYISDYCVSKLNSEIGLNKDFQEYCSFLFKAQGDVPTFNPEHINYTSIRTVNAHTDVDTSVGAYYDAEECNCFHRESIDVYKMLYGYPLLHDVCFDSLHDMKEHYEYGPERERNNKKRSRLKIFLDEFKSTLHSYKMSIKDRIELGRIKLEEFNSANPLFTSLVAVSTLLGVFGLGLYGVKKVYNRFNISEDEIEVSDLENNDMGSGSDESTAQSHEHKERRVNIRRMRQPKSLQAQSHNQNFVDTIMSVMHSMCRILVYTEKLGKETILSSDSSLNVGGDIFVMPKHFWQRVLEYVSSNAEAKIKLYWPSKSKSKFVHIDLNCVKEFPDELTWKHAEDLVYIQFKNIVCGKLLANKFVSINDNPNLVNTRLVGIRSLKHMCTEKCSVYYTGESFKIEQLKVDNCKLLGTDKSFEPDSLLKKAINYNVNPVNDSHLKVFLPQKLVEVSDFYMYENCYTIGGDCGMLLVHDDSRVVPKLLGMHTAASDRTRQGISCPIFKEDLDDVFAYFKTVVRLEDTIYTIPEIPKTGFGAQAADLDLSVEGRAGNFIKNGKIQSYKVSMPNRTRIQKSLVFDLMEEDVGPHLTEPAKLNKETIDGIVHSPMLNGLQKLTVISETIPVDQFDIISEHINQSILSWDSPMLKDDKRILTVYEALNGIEGMRPIDITTSAGFPFVKLANVTNKTPWLDIIERADLSKDLQPKESLLKMVEYRIECAKKGLIPPTIFVDTLKDECRPIDRVKKFKTRVFQVGPFDLIIAMRQYFGQFFAHCASVYITGEMGIGINPDSYDWTLLYKRLLLVGKNMIGGDYENFDGGQTVQTAMWTVNAANAFYDDGEENSLIRKVLLLSAISAMHLVDNLVYVAENNNSGNSGTTPINNIANMGYFRYVYLNTVEKDLHNYNNNVSASFTGDDNIAAVSDRIKDRFNMLTIKEHLSRLRINYTSCDKSNIETPFLDIKEVTYLKRKFVKHDRYNLYLAPLDMKTITEIARWCDGDCMNVEDQMSRFNQTLMFLAPYGQETFNKWRVLFTKYCNLLRQGRCCVDDSVVYLNFDATKLFTFDRVMGLFYPEFFKPIQDLTGVLKQTHEVLLDLGTNRDV